MQRYGNQIVLSSGAAALGIFCVAFAAHAQSQSAARPCMHWIDAATGRAVPVVPSGSTQSYTDSRRIEHTFIGIAPDGKHGHNPKTGQNYVKNDDGNWIDAKTGEAVPVVPGGSTESYTDSRGIEHTFIGIAPDGKHGHNPKTGQNYVLVPCPPTQTSSTAPPRAATYTGLHPATPSPARTPTLSGLRPGPAPTIKKSPPSASYKGYRPPVIQPPTNHGAIPKPPPAKIQDIHDVNVPNGN